MKIKSLLIGMLACSAMVACTSEDELVNNEPENKFTGNEAYLAVRLVNSDGMTSRALGNENNPFWFASSEENEVATTHFYFFENGQPKSVDGDNEVEKILSWNSNGDDASTDNTIEKVAEAVIVLEGLADKSYPTEIVAVLNKPTSLTLKNLTLEQFYSATHSSIYNDDTNKNFIMTNSTYVDETNLSDNFATKVTEANFMEQKPDAQLDESKVVKINVERLAAKVKVGVNKDKDQFKADEITIGTFNVKTGTKTSEDKSIKIKILGWGLNATTKTSYAIKNIDEGWTKDALGFEWNDVDNYRSYWAKSTNYNTGTYPASFASVSEEAGNKEANTTLGTNASEATNADDVTLNYVSWDELAGNMDASLYCMENTNTIDVLAGTTTADGAQATTPAFYSAATQVLIKAQIVNDETLVRYNRVLYTEDAFFARVLNEINLDITKKITADDQTVTYAKLSKDDLKVIDKHDGIVTIGLADASANAEWYLGTWTKEGEEDKFTESSKYTGSLADRIDALAVKAEYYKDGMMYYAIPIEHLRDGKFSYENHVAKVNEADYGVVRNHYYNVTINSIANLGTSVYNPAEDIIKPTVDGTLYFIGASINILSWKIVNQGVDL